MLLINDLSEHQGSWNAQAGIRAGRQAVILRAHTGYRPDRDFATWRAAAHVAGYRSIGIYQYLVGDRLIADQAHDLLATVGELRPGEYLIADEEDDGIALSHFPSVFATWCGIVEPASRQYASSYLGNAKAPALSTQYTGRRARWIARYGPAPTVPYTLWQRSDRAAAPGVPGPCDESVFAGSIEQLISATTQPYSSSLHAPSDEGDDEMAMTPQQEKDFQTHLLQRLDQAGEHTTQAEKVNGSVFIDAIAERVVDKMKAAGLVAKG